MKIDKNIPIPVNNVKMTHLWERMGVGDSIFFENLKKPQAVGKCISAQAFLHRRGVLAKFTVREEGTGFRMWRIQ
jgi:hypothetical protein